MSNNIKILVVVLIPILIVCFLIFNKKEDTSPGGSSGDGSDNDSDPKPTPCVTLGRVEYLEEKRVRMLRILREVRGNGPVVDELLLKYRTKALAAGKLNTADEILDYAYWAEADLEMQADNYCYVEV